jgi:aspartate aminotransferase-like enzyme
MTTGYWPELVGAEEYADVEDRFARLLDTERDLFVVQGEAILPLEASARGVGRPGSRVLNLVTSTYGAQFGAWLRSGGARVDDLVADPCRPIDAERVEEALARHSYDVVSIVHAEAASGVVNPVEEIAGLARAAGALVVVDGVASVGAEELEIDAWRLDVVVVSTQKALAGPTGASAIVVSDAAWQWIAGNSSAPRNSILSLLDWKERWLARGRSVLPVIPHHVETRLLGVALDDALAEGLHEVVSRHVAARDECRRGLSAIGLEPFVENDAEAASVVTTVRVPDGVAAKELLAAACEDAGAELEPLLSLAPAAPASALRVNHTGRRATPDHAFAAIAMLAHGLSRLGMHPGVEPARSRAR